MVNKAKLKDWLIVGGLLMIAAPGLLCIGWLDYKFRLSSRIAIEILDGDRIFVSLSRLLPTISRDVGIFYATDAIPFAISAILVGLLPRDRTWILKISGFIACVFGYLIYLNLGTYLQADYQVEIRTLLRGELVSGSVSLTTQEQQLSSYINSLLKLCDGVRLFFIIVGGGFVGLKVEKLQETEK